MSDEIKTTELETKQHPLLAARDKVKSFFKSAFAPTPPPPCEYRVVKTDGPRPLSDEMTTLALEGWRFLATTSDGILMGRNHRSHVVVDGEVQIYHRNNSVPYDYGYRSRERCDHERKPNPDRGERTIHIPEAGDGQFPSETKEHKATICANEDEPKTLPFKTGKEESKNLPFFTGLTPLATRKPTIKLEQDDEAC